MTTISNTINYTEFNPSTLKFTKLEENERSNGQLVGYPRYNKDGIDIPLEIQLPRAKTSGIPHLNQFYKTDADRSHIKILLNINNPEEAEFARKIKELDSIMSSSEMMESLLGKKAKKYKYSPLYREYIIPEEDSDEEENDKKKKSSEPKLPYIKLKLRLSYPDKKIESKVFMLEKTKDTNKKIRTKVDANTIDEFASYVRYKSYVRAVMKPFKIWAHPLSKKDPEYGISCRLERIEVDKDSINELYKSVYDSDKFIDSDDENDVIQKINNLQINTSDDNSNKSFAKYDMKKENTVEINSDSDSDSSDNEENIKKSVEFNKNIEVISDDDDSEEEVIITKPQVTKKGKKKN